MESTKIEEMPFKERIESEKYPIKQTELIQGNKDKCKYIYCQKIFIFF